MPRKRTFNINKWVQSPKWFWTFVIASGICLLVFIANLFFADIHPGTIWGLGYGIAATVLMLGVALFGVRRRIVRFTKKFGAGRAQNWVQFHVYAGTLFLLLMFMHTGFQLPTGTLMWWVFILSIWVCFSGLFGVFLQKWIPKILTSGLSVEAIYERIPELTNEIREKTEDLIKLCTDPVKDFYRKNMAPALQSPQVRLIYCIDITGGIQTQVKEFDYLRKLLPSEDKERFTQLESYYKTKLELDAHYTLQKALRWWLYLHVPTSIILVVLVGLHIYSILYY
ncbi:hypothetical protein GWO43_11605 [candidate division KSB1 bacterium]|nr:hypothetical protein [candidate division KSB1 bacterium]NIR70744.1 hypothetical protein [candidate division KSB1 bacterium]NIS24602.1 hypothetical protein [candidate division KSB1 bacterium]NIT71511.1 hypothetical protein [candidate division KSB1 bacterium]NIU25202.1 hypothetical protein [candidate division KSB1 bacterium]